MARIRTIKPEFFTSSDIVSLTPLARLFYVSLWCEADREGRLPWNTKTLKMRYLPGDDCSVDELAGELVDGGLIVIYEAAGKVYAEILTFKQHQVINNRESESLIPPRVGDAPFTRESAVQAEGKEGKGREGKEGREAIASLPAGEDPPADDELPLAPQTQAAPDCPHGDIVALYHEHLPANPRIKVWDGARQEALRTRWREDPKRQTLAYWDRFLRHVAASPFLTGKVEGTNGRPFLPGLEWLVKASNFAKIIEGRYHDRQAA